MINNWQTRNLGCNIFMITEYEGFVLIKFWIVEYKGLTIRLPLKIKNSIATWGVKELR